MSGASASTSRWADDDDLPVFDYSEISVIPDLYDENNPYCCNTPINDLRDLHEGNFLSVSETCCHILSKIRCKSDINCTINEVNNCLNVAAALSILSEKTSYMILNICDNFFRARHELLFESFMKSCKLDSEKSDMKFSSLFSIDSDRTPDFIEKDEINMKVLIIELAVTSDKGKSLQSKGKIEEGFESKYKEEISAITDLGYGVYYITVIFDVKDATDMSYMTEINNVCDYRSVDKDHIQVDSLEQLRRGFCDLYKRCNKYLHTYMSLLFKRDFEIKLESDKLRNYLFVEGDRNKERLFFKKVNTNPSLYLKASRSWERLKDNLRFLENNFDTKYSLNYDVLTNRMKFVETQEGLLKFEWDIVFLSNDKASFFENTRCTIDDRVVESNTGKIEFFITKRIQNEDMQQKRGDMPDDIFLKKHLTTGFLRAKHDLDLFETKEVETFLKRENLRFENLNYEELMLEKVVDHLQSNQENIQQVYANKKPFILNKTDVESIESSLNDYITKYDNDNSIHSGDRKCLHQKPSFSYPIINTNDGNYISYKEKNVPFIKMLLGVPNIGDYTKAILRKALDEKFKFGCEYKQPPKEIYELEVRLAENQRMIHKLQINHKDDLGVIRSSRDIPECSIFIDEQKSIRKSLKEACNRLGYKKTEISVVRVPTKSRGKNKQRSSTIGNFFAEEMKHFKSKGELSMHKGVGTFDYNILNSEYNSLRNVLLQPSEKISPDKIYDDHAAEDVNLLKMIKDDYLGMFREVADQLMHTNIYHSLTMISRMCYTLLYFSQTSIGSDYALVDNLGFEKSLMIVKGGKKIFRTKKSKLFRIFFKTYKEAIVHYKRPGFNSSYSIHAHDGEFYVLSPWIILDEVLLMDGLTMLSRCMGYTMLLNNIGDDVIGKLSYSYFNIYLALHGRRKTEEFMHNLRYLTVNCMAKYSSIGKMLPEMSGFNSDFVQCHIRESIKNNFLLFYKSLKNFHDDFKGQDPDRMLSDNPVMHLIDRNVIISNTEELTLTVYCTFLMSKAPITQSLEQVKNLRSMLKTHKLHKQIRSDDPIEQYENHTTNLFVNDNIKDYWGNLFKDDFVYDPYYATLLGGFASDYILSLKNVNELNSKWDKILCENWDSMSNSKGLRGDKNKQDFFGNKGYYVVYKELLDNSSVFPSILQVLKSDDTHFNKTRMLNKINQTFGRRISDKPLEEALFHVVDKKQRGGSREIFVMDRETKVHQQVIEKYCAFLCKMVPNELISIPSNKRLFHIHTNVFDKQVEEGKSAYNVVLDCRRWAPHSVINKFVDFILGMRRALPPSFIIHCLNFFQKMFDKKIYTRKYIFDILDKNEMFDKNQLGFLKEDADVNGYYIDMSYSWVMGIFNYLSSLMHVMNQLHISQLIRKANLSVFREDVDVHMNAHSDDSGGKIICKDDESLELNFLIYELFMKSCNHMISDKKSNIGKLYFELLSILYIGNKLLSLLGKFIGSLNFHPSDNGYSLDIMDAYTKSIELMINGSNFQQSYLGFKILSYTIWRFYFGKDVPKIYYNYPPQLLGMPDAHPLNILISGGDSDIIRLYSTENCRNLKIEDYVCISKFLMSSVSENEHVIQPIICTPQIFSSDKFKKHLEYTKILNINEKDLWSIKNVNNKNTGLMLLKYLINLKDKKFCASLQDETLPRRFSRAYFYKRGNCIMTNTGLTNYNSIRDFLNNYALAKSGVEISGEWGNDFKEARAKISDVITMNNSRIYFQALHSEVIDFNLSFDQVSYKPQDIVNNHKTCKPVHVNIQKIVSPLSTDFDPQNLTIWMCNKGMRWMLPGKQYQQQENIFRETFMNFDDDKDDLNEVWVYNLLRKYKSKFIKEYYMHSNMPASFRDVSNYKDVLMMLSHNSFKNKMINGIITPFTRTMNPYLFSTFSSLMSENVGRLMSLMDFFTGIIGNVSRVETLDKLHLKNGEKLYKGFQGMKDLMFEMEVKCKESNTDIKLLQPHLKSLLNSDEEGLLNNAYWLKNSYHYSFIKRQRLIGNAWLGKGLVYVSMPSVCVIIELYNQDVISMEVDRSAASLDRYDCCYLDYVLSTAGIPSLKTYMSVNMDMNWSKPVFGINEHGLYSVAMNRFCPMSFKSTKVIKILNEALSNIDLCQIKIEPRMKYRVFKTDFLGKKTSYIVNCFEMTSRSLMSNLRCFLNNEKNKTVLDDDDSEFGILVDDIIGDTLNLERQINLETVFDNYNLSSIYKILKHLRDNDLLSFSNLRIRPNEFPGQECGMLDCLIKYKDENPDFSFKYDRVLTPELLYLKSSQPEAFISNLTKNMKSKYETLYTSDDKRSIIINFRKIVSLMNSPNYESSLLNFLTNWGYVGVMGSLDEFEAKKNPETFKFFRYVEKDINYSDYSLRVLKLILSSIIISCDKSNIYYQTSYLGVSNNIMLKMKILSMINSFSLTSVGRRRVYSDSVLTTYRVFLNNFLKTCMENERFCIEFESCINQDNFLANAPVDSGSSLEWARIVVTCFNTYISSHHMNGILDNSRKVNQIDEKNIHVYRQLNNMSNGIVKYNLNKLFYNGTMSSDMYKFLTSEKTVIIDDNYYFLKCEFIKISEIKPVPISSSFLRNRPFDLENIDEDDFSEVSLELESAEPDMEVIEQYINEEYYIEKYDRRCYVNKGRVKYKAIYMDVKIVNMVGFYSNGESSNYISQAGETVLIIADFYIYELINVGCDRVGIFKPNTGNYMNKSMIDPDSLIYYFIDSETVNVDLIEKTFDCKYVPREDIANIIVNTSYGVYYNQKGKLINNKDFNENYQLSYNMINSQISEDEEDDEDYEMNEEEENVHDIQTSEKIEKAKTLIEKLSDEGLDEKFIYKYSKHLEDIKIEVINNKENTVVSLEEKIQFLIQNLESNIEAQKKIKDSIDSILKGEKSRNFIERVYEIPGVFATNIPQNSDIKNRSLGDTKVRAEIESLSVGLCDKILSARCFISKKMFNNCKRQSHMYKSFIKSNPKKYSNKKFLVDIFTLIINDAHVVTDSDSDMMWNDIMMNLSEHIIEEEEDMDIEEDETYDVDAGGGILKYRYL